jgi:hypothetical protein
MYIIPQRKMSLAKPLRSLNQIAFTRLELT